jgi:endonuclease/exonuclease/phosphatase family metal-dependent hydrolase
MRNDELAWLATQCASEPGPLIVMGDFNETMYGWAYGEFLSATALKNARNGFGRMATWPSMIAGVRIPDLLRIPIDHCLVSPHFAVESFAIGVEGISDHAPIDVRLVRLSDP